MLFYLPSSAKTRETGNDDEPGNKRLDSYFLRNDQKERNNGRGKNGLTLISDCNYFIITLCSILEV
jgi:hypothetical protein